MRINGKTATLVTTLIYVLLFPALCGAEVLLSVTGMAAIEGGNIAKTEQKALQDAFAKAALQAGLHYVPNTSVSELVSVINDYVSARGTQDIIQYQITSRTQLSGVLTLRVEVKLNDDGLREWVSSKTVTMPAGARPRLLLMISFSEPGKAKPYEWWKDKNTFSPFEAQLAQRLSRLGENILELPQKQRALHADSLKALDVARSLSADMVLSGSISYTQPVNRVYECSLKLTLLEVRSQKALSSWSISHKGDFPFAAMNSLMIDEVITSIRSQVTGILTTQIPTSSMKTLCIEDISDYSTYNSMISAIKQMGNVSRLSITRISGHSICHSMEVKGNLTDILENLKNKNIAEADMMADKDTARVRLLYQ